MSYLTAETLRSLFSYDPITGNFVRRVSRKRSEQGRVLGAGKQGDGYVHIFVGGKYYLAHRLAWLYTHGVWPTDQLDHINRDRRDNSLANLRECNNKQNQQNLSHTGRSGVSGHVGVSAAKRVMKDKWVAYITDDNGVRLHLGVFDAKQQAVYAYKEAKKLAHSFCAINVGETV